MPAIDEVSRKTPPSGLALKVGSALRNRCRLPLQFTAQHLTTGQGSSFESEALERQPTLSQSSSDKASRLANVDILVQPYGLVLSDGRLRLDCETDRIGNQDIETPQAVDSLLHRVLAFGQYTLILGRLRQLLARCIGGWCRYSFHEDGLAVVSVANLLGDLLGPIFARIVVDGDIAAFSSKLLRQQGTEASANMLMLGNPTLLGRHDMLLAYHRP